MCIVCARHGRVKSFQDMRLCGSFSQLNGCFGKVLELGCRVGRKRANEFRYPPTNAMFRMEAFEFTVCTGKKRVTIYNFNIKILVSVVIAFTLASNSITASR